MSAWVWRPHKKTLSKKWTHCGKESYLDGTTEGIRCSECHTRVYDACAHREDNKCTICNTEHYIVLKKWWRL
jgi:hypothetical protein